ncbi:hypothetical protein ES707_04052 [subsurface metagenome]
MKEGSAEIMTTKAKVLLMDLDVIKKRKPSPNLALMKLSAYHKARGDEIFLNFPLNQPDITYTSCVFTWNAKRRSTVPNGAFIGGSGIDLKAELPTEVEHIMPDYSLYPGVDFSLGFTSRGCIKRCPWCIVPEKEGQIKAWTRIYEFWDKRHRKIILLDNNLLAAPNWRQTMEDLIAENLEVDFNQGLDIRMLNEDNLGYLKRVKAKRLRFAFDHIGYEKAVREGIELLRANGLGSRKLSFYLLYGFPIIEQECIERVRILSSYNVDIYPMAYKEPDGKEPRRRILKVDDIPLLHGSRQNIDKFLRLVGRIPC